MPLTELEELELLELEEQESLSADKPFPADGIVADVAQPIGDTILDESALSEAEARGETFPKTGVSVGDVVGGAVRGTAEFLEQNPLEAAAMAATLHPAVAALSLPLRFVIGATSTAAADIAEEKLGFEAPETIVGAGEKAVLEETVGAGIEQATKLIGKAVGKAGKAVAAVTPYLQDFVNKTDDKVSRLKEKFIKQESRVGGEFGIEEATKAIDVEDDVLTVFQKTGGEVGASEQEHLARASAYFGRNDKSESAVFNADTRFLANTKKAIMSGEDLSKQTPDFQKEITGTMNNELDRIKLEMDSGIQPVIDKELLNEKNVIKLVDVDESIANARKALVEKPDSDVDKIFGAIDNAFRHGADKSIGLNVVSKGSLKNEIPISELNQLEKKLIGMADSFKEGGKRQTNFNNTLGQIRREVLEPLKLRALAMEDAPSGTKKWIKAKKMQQDLLLERDSIEEARVSMRAGVTDIKQGQLAKKGSQLMKNVFESRQAFDDASALLSKYNPILLDTMKKTHKRDIFHKVLTDGETLNHAKFTKYLDDNQEVIRAAHGENYLKELEFIELRLKARDVGTKPLRAVGTAQEIVSKKELAAAPVVGLVHPLKAASMAIAFFTDRFKKISALQGKTDREVFNAMIGKEGEDFFSKLLSTPIASPESYPLYVRMSRAMGVKPLDTDEFYNSIDFIDEVEQVPVEENEAQ